MPSNRWLEDEVCAACGKSLADAAQVIQDFLLKGQFCSHNCLDAARKSGRELDRVTTERDGQIQFLSDCAHNLAGQTVPLTPEPPIDKENNDG